MPMSVTEVFDALLQRFPHRMVYVKEEWCEADRSEPNIHKVLVQIDGEKFEAESLEAALDAALHPAKEVACQ